MLRWEYCSLVIEVRPKGEVSFVDYSVEGAKYREVIADVAQGDHDAIDAAYRLIGQLGRDGWEMVSATATVTPAVYPTYAGSPRRQVYFKRPL